MNDNIIYHSLQNVPISRSIIISFPCCRCGWYVFVHCEVPIHSLVHNKSQPWQSYILIPIHYNDVIMNAIASQITGVSIIHSTVGSGADQRKHQSSASPAFVRAIQRWPVNSPHKRPVTREMFPFDGVSMFSAVVGMINGLSNRVSTLLIILNVYTCFFSLDYRNSNLRCFLRIF